MSTDPTKPSTGMPKYIRELLYVVGVLLTAGYFVTDAKMTIKSLRETIEFNQKYSANERANLQEQLDYAWAYARNIQKAADAAAVRTGAPPTTLPQWQEIKKMSEDRDESNGGK